MGGKGPLGDGHILSLCLTASEGLRPERVGLLYALLAEEYSLGGSGDDAWEAFEPPDDRRRSPT